MNEEVELVEAEDTTGESRVLLVVEEQDDAIKATTLNFTAMEAIHIINYLVGVIEQISGISHNEILDDLKYQGEEYETEDIGEINE